MNTSTNLTVTPFAEGFGAAISGFDATMPIHEAEAGFLREAFLEHQILCIRGAPLPPEKFRDIGRVFGIPVHQVLSEKHDLETPEVSVLDTTFRDGRPADKTALRAASWHTDGSHFACPYKATLLHAHAVPSRGGNTRFCNMYAAYDALSDADKQRIDGLQGVHAHNTVRAKEQPADDGELKATDIAAEVAHPLARPHPVTGRRALFLSSNRLDRVEGLERDASDDLLDSLYAHADQAAFQYAHVWQLGDVVIWDNACLLHAVTNDYPTGEERIMHRMIIEGESP